MKTQCFLLFTFLFYNLHLLAVLDISVSGSPGTLTINSAIAGSKPTTVKDNTTTYSLTVTETTQKIVGRVDQLVPNRTKLKVSLKAPTGATSLGSVPLTTIDQDLVTNIPNGTYSNLKIRYRFSANIKAGIVPLTSRTVTFTVLAQ